MFLSLKFLKKIIQYIYIKNMDRISKNRSKVLVKFGQNLSNYRKKTGLSQEKLGLIVGLHRTTIGEIERGEQNISLINLVNIAGALEINVDLLLENIEPTKVSSVSIKANFNKTLEKIFEEKANKKYRVKKNTLK
jgi:transcriptional regulator with XRE-family HTH domain